MNTTKPNSTTNKPAENTKTKSNAKSKQPAQNTTTTTTSDDTKKPAVKKNHVNEKGEKVVKERSLAEDLKTEKSDAGAASDESWEKDFDLSDP